MQRDLSALSNSEFDLIVVGGGIFGACTAWDAALRGLSVALVERDDFSGATSAQCFKMVHGGIRYLQHGDLLRLRQSARERSILLRVAPHLVSPLPIDIPTYGHGKKGKGFLGLGASVYDLLTLDRNRGISDERRRIPSMSLVSAAETRERFPQIDARGLTGAVRFHDAQMYNAPRLALSFIRGAAQQGAVCVNYCEVVELSGAPRRVAGVRVRDRLAGGEFAIRGRVVINAAGPWADGLLAGAGCALARPSVFSRDACLITSRRPTTSSALAVPGRTRDPDALLSRDARHLFIVPWRDCTLLGVWHKVWPHGADRVDLSAPEREAFLEEINWAAPGLELKAEEVRAWQAGLVLFGANQPGAVHLSYGKRSRLIDHAVTHGCENLISLIGVRYTTARGEAEQAVDLALKKLGRTVVPSQSAFRPVFGGAIESFDGLIRTLRRRHGESLGDDTLDALARNHGDAAAQVLKRPGADACLGDGIVLEAEVRYAAQEEAAVRLEDVVFRRTDLGTAGHPGAAALSRCAAVMGEELGWGQAHRARELAAVDKRFAHFGFEGPETSSAG